MNTITLILAAGKATRFGGINKQLLKIGNETVLQRITRQCRFMNAATEPIVVTHNAEIQAQSGLYFVPEAHSVTCETILSTRELWQKRTVILLGDVIYSKKTMGRIYQVERSLAVFGNTWEVFAVIFDIGNSETVIAALEKAQAYRLGKLRYFYKAYCGFEMDCEEIEGLSLERDIFIYTHDWTRDIDSPGEYESALRELVERRILEDC